MKHLEVRQNYSAARRIFNCLLSVLMKHRISCLIYSFILPVSCSWSFTWPLNLCMSFVKAQGCNGDETAFLIDTCVHKSGLPCEITKARVKRRTLLFL